MKIINKVTSLILIFAMVFSLSSNAFAAVDKNELEIHNETSDGIQIRITEEENINGSFTYREYWDGQLKESHTTVPGSGVVTNETYKNGKKVSIKTEKVSDNCSISTYATTGRQVRTLGYMNYYNGIIEPISILCTVDEYYSPNKDFTINKGLSMSISGWITTIVTSTALYSKIAKNVYQALLLGGIIAFASNNMVAAQVTYTVHANIYEQTIIGKCTTHSKPERSLPKGQIAYVNTGSGLKIYTEGYNTTMWGTGELGRQMFLKVWGTEYTPTSWTGL